MDIAAAVANEISEFDHYDRDEEVKGIDKVSTIQVTIKDVLQTCQNSTFS